MKNVSPKRQKSVTLKQYMHNNSLRKRVISRASSKQRSQLVVKQTNANSTNENIGSNERNKLIQQIKLTLARNISSQTSLASILKMFCRLIDLYNKQIQEKNLQTGLLSTMIQGVQDGSSIKFTQSRKMEEPKGISLNLESLKSSLKNQQDNLNRTSGRNSNSNHHYRNPSNTSSEQIPNINVLLMTRNQPFFDKINDQETKQTLLDHSFQSPRLNQSKISIDINQSRTQEGSFMNSRISSSPYYKFSKTPNTSSSIKSTHSAHWRKNPQENSILSKFQQLKQRIKK